jgi:hypothetical protein
MTNVGISTDLARMAGWETESTWTALLSQLDEANKKAESARHQQLAYTGWLTFNPDYQREKRELFESWKTLDFEVSWPLISNIGDAEAVAMTTVDIGNVDKLPKTAAAFVGEAAKFMRHWKISRMVTWDLPLTQGPLEHVPHGAAHHLLGPDQTTSSYPSHYDIPSKQNLRTETQTQQQIAGEDTGISRDFPLTHLSARAGLASRTENAFKLWLIEATANRRFPRRRGLATQLSCILENMLDCSADRIKQLRRVYRPYLSHFAIS